MARIPLYDAVFFYLDIIGLTDDFLELIDIFRDVLLKLIGGLVILGLKLGVVGRLL